MKGIDKRCGCRDETGTKLGARCPLLARSGHGSYGYRIDLGPGLDARGQFRQRRQQYQGGYARRRDAQQARAEHLTLLGQGQTQARNDLTVAVWLEQWLTGKVNLRATTQRSYASHLRLYLVPHLGHLRLRDLNASHIERMYAAIRADSARRAGQGERATGPATIRRVHATLSSALNTAVKRQLLAHNPAQHVELERSDRPEVTPWQPDELGAFLDAAAGDRLGALYELMAFTGLRRGEALGLRWADVDMQAGVLRVRQTLTDIGGRLAFGKPKTRGSERLVDLDSATLGALLAHQLAQDSERAAWGDAYVYSGLVFTREDGQPLRPEYVTRRMQAIAERAGLPRKRLHDLRHGSASLQLMAGVPIAVVSKRLGHSSLSITSDTYSHLLRGVGRDAAEAAAALVPRGAWRPAGDREDTACTPAAQQQGERAPVKENAQVRTGAPPGTRTPNPRIKSCAHGVSDEVA